MTIEKIVWHVEYLGKLEKNYTLYNEKMALRSILLYCD